MSTAIVKNVNLESANLSKSANSKLSSKDVTKYILVSALETIQDDAAASPVNNTMLHRETKVINLLYSFDKGCVGLVSDMNINTTKLLLHLVKNKNLCLMHTIKWLVID